jgi:hypothetical protein
MLFAHERRKIQKIAQKPPPKRRGLFYTLPKASQGAANTQKREKSREKGQMNGQKE